MHSTSPTFQLAKFWQRAVLPIAQCMHKRYGALLSMELEDCEQESWLVACDAAGKAGDDANVMGYVTRSVQCHFLSKVRSKLAERKRVHAWLIRENPPSEETEQGYTIDDVVELRELASTFSLDEWALLDSLHSSNDVSDRARKLGVSVTTYYKRSGELRARVEGVLER